MKTLINKITTAVSGAVLFAAAIAMAGLGFAVIATLAFFAVLAIGITLLTAPFIRTSNEEEETIEDAEVVA
ncbi:MAG: hypothetical protein AAGK93_00640 [Pseudomonadota bacterium]